MLNILCGRIKQIWPSFTLKAIKMTSSLKFLMSLPHGMVQRWELLPPTNVARVQIPASMPYVAWVCFGSFLCSEMFFSRYSRFPLSSKTNIFKFQFNQESGRQRTGHFVKVLPLNHDFFKKINFIRKVKRIKQNKTFILSLTLVIIYF